MILSFAFVWLRKLLRGSQQLSRSRVSFLKSRANIASDCTQSCKHLRFRLQFVRALFRQRIDHPILIPRCYDHSSVSKIAKVLRDFHLWLTENVLKMTDTERRSCKKMEDAQSRAIAKALVDLDQIHVGLTTSRGCGTTTSGCLALATLTRPTLCPAALQDKI